MRTRLLAGAALAVALVAGCTPHPVGPARTYSAYEGKAATTARSALSAVETTRLAASAATAGDAFGPYVSVLVSGQEDGLAGVQGTFASIQPPDGRSDGLRAQLGELLQTALDHVAAVRIAARRGELADLEDVAAPLESDAAALRRFVDEHGS